MNELNDFFKVISEAKATDPKQKIIKEVKKAVQEDLNEMFSQLESPKKKEVLIEEPVQLKEIVEPVLPTPQEKQDSVNTYVASLPKDSHSFQQPIAPQVNPEMKVVTDKIKFLEKWVAKISAAGPGSGEVNFRYLDDVNRSTMAPSNDNWLLEYDSASKKVQFTEHVGPIRSIKLNTAGPQLALTAGQIAYNPEEDCLDIKHNDGTTLQTGLENHIRVHNHLTETITNGTVIMFAGVENINAIALPIVGKYVANSNAFPLYIIGVLTGDIVPGGTGRATVFGYVRDLNTTGSSVGETWNQGDLLWAHPSIPGALTKVRPTAPNVATSIAAVVRVGTTDGQILVRPTIWPRLYYGDWFDTTNQTATAANTAYAVKMNTSGAVSGFELIDNGTAIKALNAGRYNFEFSLQVTSTNSSSSRIYIWYRLNGVDVPHSATVMTIAANGGKLAPAWNFPVLMNPNDTFTLMWATDSTSVSLSAEPATAFCPSIPSVIITVAQTNL